MIDSSQFLRYNSFDYLVVDYETCHLNLQSSNNKPWQVSFLLERYEFDGNRHKTTEIKRLNHYLKWKPLDISIEAERITGFNRKEYEARAVDPENVLDILDSVINDGKTFIVGHNFLGFDIYIHNIYRRLLGRKTDYSFTNRVIDTNLLSKLYKLEMTKPQEMSLIEWQLKISNVRTRGVRTNLKAMCKEFDIETEDDKLHDAMYDVGKTKEIFKKIIWKMEI